MIPIKVHRPVTTQGAPYVTRKFERQVMHSLIHQQKYVAFLVTTYTFGTGLHSKHESRTGYSQSPYLMYIDGQIAAKRVQTYYVDYCVTSTRSKTSKTEVNEILAEFQPTDIIKTFSWNTSKAISCNGLTLTTSCYMTYVHNRAKIQQLFDKSKVNLKQILLYVAI
jgi:hypothetical protein